VPERGGVLAAERRPPEHLRTQLLILKYLQLNATFGWSLSNLVALLRMNLFAYRDLWA